MHLGHPKKVLYLFFTRGFPFLSLKHWNLELKKYKKPKIRTIMKMIRE